MTETDERAKKEAINAPKTERKTFKNDLWTHKKPQAPGEVTAGTRHSRVPDSHVREPLPDWPTRAAPRSLSLVDSRGGVLSDWSGSRWVRWCRREAPKLKVQRRKSE